ncbi:MAG: PQQ-binding-like beta-propeller repeat protein [Mariniblastus sp.]
MNREIDAQDPGPETDGTIPKSRLSFSLRTIFILFCLLSVVFWYVDNQLNQSRPAPNFWDEASGKNIKWAAKLGSQTYSRPVVSDKYVFIGSNNGAGYDPKFPAAIDLGVILCFDKETGRFVWQYSSPKLESGRAQDWPLQGISSTAFVDGDRLWSVTNRGEVICLDTEGFLDKENDGPFNSESSSLRIDADVVWKFDMIKQLGVYPHNISHCNVEVDQERVYVKTSNGVDASHRELPSPDAPSFVVLDKISGELIWQDNAPGNSIMHGSWGSPKLATLDSRKQILFPGGDGWLYSYKPEGDGQGNSVLYWKFDCNPKTSTYRAGRSEGRNNLLTAPTIHESRIFIAMGQDPEHGEGPSRVWCIEPGLKTGDLSPTLVNRGNKTEQPSIDNLFRHCIVENGDKEIPNPNSAKVWEFNGYQNGKTFEPFNRSLGRPVVANGCVFIKDLTGFLYCVDANTGAINWRHDTLSASWTSVMVVGNLLFHSSEDGFVDIIRADADVKVASPDQPLAHIDALSYTAYYSNMTFENGVLYLANTNRLIAVEDPETGNQIQTLLK